MPASTTRSRRSRVTERSITGSIDSAVILVDALAARAPTWDPVLAEMNTRAAERVRDRPYHREPEAYRLDVACR